MAVKQHISKSKKPATREDKKRRLEAQYTNEFSLDISIEHAFNEFIIHQMAKGNSKATIDYYKRVYIKIERMIIRLGKDPKAFPIQAFNEEISQLVFIKSLGDVNQQTINSYLRGYRAFGNWCEEKGYLDGFKCSIKETEPKIKEVYTDKELKKLLVPPPTTYFEAYRNYVIIVFLLATGARSNTILNIKIKDVDLEDGYVNLNTLKNQGVARIGLEKKALIVLREYISLWRTGGDTEEDDYLFCNCYGEQMTRSGLATAIKRYNNERGVDKTSIHLFRHTFAKKWITSGGDLISLSKVLTHKELDMVKKYANLFGADIKNEIEEHSALSQLRTNSGKTLKTKRREVSLFDDE